MTTTIAQQVALDNALVAPENRVQIGKCNMRIDPTKTLKKSTYQIVLDALTLTTCYPAFLITADVPEIYMHQFWFTINKKDSTSYRFKIDVSLCGGLESVSIRRIQCIGYDVLEFLGVGTTFDIFQNIHMLYIQYDVLVFSGYGVLSLFPLWSLVSAGTDKAYWLSE
ncbi:hypothetical protein Tco_0285878 [Tanacetum coccineum]